MHVGSGQLDITKARGFVFSDDLWILGHKKASKRGKLAVAGHPLANLLLSKQKGPLCKFMQTRSNVVRAHTAMKFIVSEQRIVRTDVMTLTAPGRATKYVETADRRGVERR